MLKFTLSFHRQEYTNTLHNIHKDWILEERSDDRILARTVNCRTKNIFFTCFGSPRTDLSEFIYLIFNGTLSKDASGKNIQLLGKADIMFWMEYNITRIRIHNLTNQSGIVRSIHIRINVLTNNQTPFILSFSSLVFANDGTHFSTLKYY